MGYLRITAENVDGEHICCAMSNNQSVRKKEWLKARFDEGLVFYRSEERGKCFIEYLPAEHAWHPLVADGYLHIDCLCGLLEGVRANVMAEPTVGVQIPGPSWASDVLELSDADRADIAKQAAAFLAFMEG